MPMVDQFVPPLPTSHPTVMQLHATLLIGILLTGAAVRAEANGIDVRQQYVAARQQVDIVHQTLDEARSLLAALKAERRIQSALSAIEPTPPPRANPEFERLNSEVRDLELQVRKLSEQMAPAHPELIAAEAELEAARSQLAATPQFLDVDPTVAPSVNRHSEVAASAAAKIAQAENDLRLQQERLATALNAERQALSELLTLPREVSAPKVEEAQMPQRQDAGWIFAGIASAALLLLILVAGLSRAEKSPPSLPSESVAPLAPTSRRIIYSASEAPSPAAINTKPRRAPIVPRRRVS
jgi:hypothetical protein